jgi:hypothetical protein
VQNPAAVAVAVVAKRAAADPVAKLAVVAKRAAADPVAKLAVVAKRAVVVKRAAAPAVAKRAAVEPLPPRSGNPRVGWCRRSWFPPSRDGPSTRSVPTSDDGHNHGPTIGVLRPGGAADGP